MLVMQTSIYLQCHQIKLRSLVVGEDTLGACVTGACHHAPWGALGDFLLKLGGRRGTSTLHPEIREFPVFHPWTGVRSLSHAAAEVDIIIFISRFSDDVLNERGKGRGGTQRAKMC